ncbi:MAG: hypothetical protein DMG58_02525 [Acidobacteria bacterium]|nr:MAG: hypothetical protein DMG58_02525 [Acidobacteriota bacterium]
MTQNPEHHGEPYEGAALAILGEALAEAEDLMAEFAAEMARDRIGRRTARQLKNTSKGKRSKGHLI